MTLDFDLYQDWTDNEKKRQVIEELSEKANDEKRRMPILLSRFDLQERWQMNNRQSVHNVVKNPEFPNPILNFSNGKTPVYLESEIEIFEINHPWVLRQETREKYAMWILKNVINK